MRREEVQQLRHGLYEILWKAGGSSLAAVGSTTSGLRWYAPTNWVSDNKERPAIASTNWRRVKSVSPFVTN